MKIKDIVISKSRLFFTLLSVFIMIIIFLFSSENGTESSKTSGVITEYVTKNIIADFHLMPETDKSDILDAVSHIVRKTAHFSIYAALGFFISLSVGKRKIFSSGTFLSLAICFTYACTDELHQYFVPGRGCQFRDVIIDTSGSFTGIIISLGAIFIIFKIKEKQKNALQEKSI